MRVGTGKVTPVLMDRSTERGRKETRADKLLGVVLELLSQADDAARAGDAVFLARRLREADRVLRYLPPGYLVKSVKRAEQRSSALHHGEIPPPPRIFPSSARVSSAETPRAAKAVSFPTVSPKPKPKPQKSPKALGTGVKQRRQIVRAAAKSRLAADLARRSGHSCGVCGSVKGLSLKSGRPRCEKCHAKWAIRRCPRCGSAWTRTSPADSRRRNCPKCRRPGYSMIVSAGAPSLGRRR